MRYNTINSQSELMEGDMAGWRDMVGRRDAEGNVQEIKMPDVFKRDPKDEERLREGGLGAGTFLKVLAGIAAGSNPAMSVAVNAIAAAANRQDGDGNVKGAATANPDADRIAPGDGGAAEVTEEHKQKIENEIEARGIHPDSYAAEQLRKENAEFARQTGYGSRAVDNAETLLGIPGALDASELPASREQELQNHSIVLYGKRYAVQRLHGKQYLIPIEED